MNKKTLAIAIIIALTISTLLGCGTKDEVEPTLNTIESTEEAVTVESIEEVAVTEPEPDELDIEPIVITDEYLADYTIDYNEQSIYVKYPSNFIVYDDFTTDSSIWIYVDDSVDFFQQTYIEYTINHPWNIDYYIENQDVGLLGNGTSTIEIIEELYNDIVVYKTIETFGDNELNQAQLIRYIITFSIADTDDEMQITITDNHTVGIEPILDFYVNAEDLMLIVP